MRSLNLRYEYNSFDLNVFYGVCYFWIINILLHMMFKLFATTVLLSLCASDAFKILVIFPVPGKSHGILGDGFIRHLLNAGHEVTYITAFPWKKPHANLTQVYAESNFKVFNENSMNIKAIMDKQLNMKDYDFLHQLMVGISKSTVNDHNVQKLLQDRTQKFDAIVGEWMFSEVYSTIAAIYDCPFIWFSSLEPHWHVTRLIDEPLSPAYNADILSDASPPFSFFQRVEELWQQITGQLTKNRFMEIEREVYQSSIVPILKARAKAVPSYEDLMYNGSLILGNSHVSMGLAPRLPQSYKPIGGYHIDSKPGPLPDNLKNLFENSKHGVIYFSMGSNLKSKDIPENLKAGFLKIFSNLKQTVLWKFEEVLPDLPKNVHIVTWAPQQSILAHPNCILFITHGGLLSTTETIHYGKPIIGIPVFADQFANVQRAIEKGFGRRVDLTYTMDAELKIQIDEILSNPKYAQKAKEWAFIYHDRPNTPGQELVHWTEHVIKTGGALHLRSPALLVPWYQKMYLDLIAVVILAISAVILALVKVLGVIFKLNKSMEKKKAL